MKTLSMQWHLDLNHRHAKKSVRNCQITLSSYITLISEGATFQSAPSEWSTIQIKAASAWLRCIPQNAGWFWLKGSKRGNKCRRGQFI